MSAAVQTGLHRAVLLLGFGSGSGFSSLLTAAGGLQTWQSLPQVGVLEARQLASLCSAARNQYPARSLSGLADSWRARPPLRAGQWHLLHSHMLCGSLSPHCLADSLLAPGRPLTSKGGGQEA